MDSRSARAAPHRRRSPPHCHSGAGAPEGLELDAANSYALLVGVSSNEDPGRLRVKPGSPDNSYLVLKLQGSPGIVGAQMPFGGPPLPQSTIDVVRQWITQLAVSNGTAGGAATTSGKQSSAQMAFVESTWRLGAALNYNGAAAAGSRRAAGIFGGLKTGPIVWLGEADLIDDRSLANGGVKMLATLAEADWTIARGHNLKVTAEESAAGNPSSSSKRACPTRAAARAAAQRTCAPRGRRPREESRRPSGRAAR
jgi:hypothetical protein